MSNGSCSWHLGLRVDLLEFELVQCGMITVLIKDKVSRADRTLVNRPNESLGNTAHACCPRLMEARETLEADVMMDLGKLRSRRIT